MAAANYATAQPIATFDRTEADLGTILWKIPATTHFTVTNRGDKPLLITHVDTDCGCTAAEWTTTPIAAGSTGTITATYDAGLLGRFRKSIGIYTNIDDQPYYLDIVGTVSAQLNDYSSIYPHQIGNICLERNFIDFGDISKGEHPTATINIINTGDTEYAPTLMHLPPYITVQSIPDTLARQQSGKLLLTLNTERLPHLGLTESSIYLSRFMGDKVTDENKIALSAMLLPDFSQFTAAQKALSPSAQVSSDQLFMNQLIQKKKQTQTITVSNTGRSVLKIESIQVSSPALNVSLNKSQLAPGEHAKVKITAIRSFVKEWPTHAHVWMITNSPITPKVTIDVEIKKP